MRIIGEAGIRLRSDSTALAADFRRAIVTALRQASADLPSVNVLDGTEKEANRTSTRIKSILSGLLGSAQAAGRGLATAILSGTKLVLIGTAAAAALAGITSLTTGIIALGAAVAQASGVIGFLPAILASVKALTTTVKIGVEGMGDAFSAMAEGDAAAFAEALKKLAPSARAFVLEVQKVKPAFDAIKLSVQQKMFEGLGASIVPLAKVYLPLTSRLFGDIATEVNRAAKQTAAFALQGDTAQRVTGTVGSITASFHNLLPAMTPIISALLDITRVGATFLPGFSAGLASAAQGIAANIRQAADSGALAAFFQRAIDTVRTLGQILVQFGAGLGAIFKAAEAAGGGFLNNLLEIGKAFNQFVSSAQGQQALIGFFTAMRAVLAAVMPVIQAVATVIGTTLAPILGQVATIIGPALLPVIQAIGAGLQAAQPGIIAFAQGLGEFLKAAAPLITIVGQLAGILGGALGQILRALAPVATKLADAISKGLGTIMPQLEPIISSLATALAGLIESLLPLVPVFLELLAAVLPILPPLVNLVATILPPLISLIQALMPIVTALAQILTALLPPIAAVARVILDILIPPIKLIAAVVAQVAGLVADLFRALSSTVTTILSALGSIISGIWGGILAVFTGILNAIGATVRGAFEGIRSTIANILGGVATVVRTGLDTVVNFFRELPGRIGQFFATIASDAFEAGKNIIQGIIRGLGNLAGAIVDKIKSIVQNAWGAVLDFFGIGSPSKLAEDTFVWVGKGAIRGLEKIAPSVADAAAVMAADAMGALSSGLTGGIGIGNLGGSITTAGGGVGGGQTIVLHQTNIMQPGADVTQFAAEVTTRGAQRLAAGPASIPVSVGSVQSGMAAPDTVFGVTGGMA